VRAGLSRRAYFKTWVLAGLEDFRSAPVPGLETRTQ